MNSAPASKVSRSFAAFTCSIAQPLITSCRTYDEYRSELLSGHLSWTPVHESDLFWKENATKLNDKDYELLKYVSTNHPSSTSFSLIPRRILIKLLNESTDATVLAVASHDLGQYVKHYERGKKWVTSSFTKHERTNHGLSPES